MTKPSWQDFGTHDESAYPELWDGVVGAWAPCLGPTGSRLHDMSRRSNWGTLTNMDNATDWVIDGGQYALDFDGSNDYVQLSLEEAGRFGVEDFTISSWLKWRDSQGFQIAIGRDNLGARAWWLGADTSIRFFDLTGGARHVVSTVDPVAARWYHVAVTRSLLRRAIYINGLLNVEVLDTSVSNFSASGLTQFGRRAYAGFERFFSGQIDDVVFWRRAISASDVQQLYQLGRGGMYQRRRRRAIYLPQAGFQAAWALRRSQIIGGGLR